MKKKAGPKFLWKGTPNKKHLYISGRYCGTVSLDPKSGFWNYDIRTETGGKLWGYSATLQDAKKEVERRFHGQEKN